MTLAFSSLRIDWLSSLGGPRILCGGFIARESRYAAAIQQSTRLSPEGMRCSWRCTNLLVIRQTQESSEQL